MSHPSKNTTLETSSENASNSVDPNFAENPNQTWKNFKLTNSLEYTNSKQYDLLKTTSCSRSVTSPLGDFRFSVGNTKYILDRAILASKSYQLRDFVTDYDGNEFANKIDYLIDGDDTRFSNIVDIIYGKELETVMTENNFSQLFHDMYWIRLEIDLEIFRKFIEKNIQPKVKLNSRMFDFYHTLIMDNYFGCDYLLPTLSRHISDHLREICHRREFLSLSEEGFIRILFNRSENSQEKGSIGHICAKWICHDFQTRINHLKDLVNVVKFRYGLLPYCDWNPDLMKFLPKNQGNEESQVKEVEQCFNELLFNHGNVSFASPPNLKGVYCIESGVQKVHSINQTYEWLSFLKEGIFCDVAINVKGTSFKLHRVKLLMASEYFRDIFIDQNDSSTTNVEDKSNSESTTMEYSLDHIDPVTFQSIIRYIYEHEIEVISQSQLISLIKGSQFLKMNDLFEKCFSMMLKIARNGDISDIFEVFQYACENAKYSELYDVLAEEMVELWPKLDEIPNFKNISLGTLKEILSLPNLKLNNPDEMLDLCSGWIFHDYENRYHRMIQVAKAINRNFMIDSDKFKLEIPLNTTFSARYVKKQLTKVLCSTAPVSLNANCIENKRKNPKFLLLNEDKFLSVVDVNFNEIIQLAQITGDELHYSATMIEDELFILFNDDDQFHFQSYSLATNKMVSLATDFSMTESQNYVILSCNNQVYFCDNYDVLEFDAKLNRWIYLLDVYKESESFVKYTSDGKRIYKMFKEGHKEQSYRFSFYDFQHKEWTDLPSISDSMQHSRSDADEKSTNVPIKVDIINHELSVMFTSKIQKFNWTTRTWQSVSYSNENFVEFTGHEENVLYISDKNEVHVYSPVFNKWTLERKLDNVSNIVAIHAIGK